jgi:hypothetical protein
MAGMRIRREHIKVTPSFPPSLPPSLLPSLSPSFPPSLLPPSRPPFLLRGGSLGGEYFGNPTKTRSLSSNSMLNLNF